MVDGASYWQRVRRITLPLTARTILLVTLFSVIGSLLAFDQFFLMTAGQPFNQTASSVFWIYLNSFPYLKLGYGAALSLILAVIILACTVVQMVLTPAEPRVSASTPVRRRCSASIAARRTAYAACVARPGTAGRKYLVGAICVALCAIMLAPLVAVGPRVAQDDAGGGGDPADLLPARSSASTAITRLWNYQDGLPTYLFNSARHGAPDDPLHASR